MRHGEILLVVRRRQLELKRGEGGVESGPVTRSAGKGIQTVGVGKELY